MNQENDIKIVIPLTERSGQSFKYEKVWAELLSDDLYKVWNVPAYAYNINIADIVRCRIDEDGIPVVISVVERSGAKTVWIYFSETTTPNQINNVLDSISSVKPLIEKGSDRFWYAGFRTEDDCELAIEKLENYQEEGLLEFERGEHPEEPFAKTE